MKWLKWENGRQGTGYRKMLLLTGTFPLPFDVYLINFPQGSRVTPHRDPVPKGRHYRLNVVLKEAEIGGTFICKGPLLFEKKRIKLFRPDIQIHAVSKILKGSRYLLSVGWVLNHEGHSYAADQVTNGEPNKGSVCSGCGDSHKGWDSKGKPL